MQRIWGLIALAIGLAMGEPGVSEPDQIFRACERALATGKFDSRASALRNSAEAYTKSVLNVPNLVRRKAIAYRDEVLGDVLVVKWDISEPYVTGELIL